MSLFDSIFIPTRQPLTAMPRAVASKAIAVYLFTVCAVSVIFHELIMEWYCWIYGITAVFGFFYYTYNCTNKWQLLSEKKFVKKVIITSLVIRCVYVLLSYWFYYEVAGCYGFEFAAADSFTYEEMGFKGAELLRQGQLNLEKYLFTEGYLKRFDFSDHGYGIYLSWVYFLIPTTNPIPVRLLKAVWSSLIVLLMYRLAQRNFGENIARITAIMCMLMPNLIFYCGLHLKEIEMTFLTTLFVERGDNLLRKGKFAIGPTIFLFVITFVLFAFRTVLAMVLVIALLTTLVFSSERIVSWGKKLLVGVLAIALIGVVFKGEIEEQVKDVIDTGQSEQTESMKYRTERENGNTYAKYASAAVFAPLIFTIPFPTMVATPTQENQRLLNGGNFVKNIISYCVILAMIMMLLHGGWRKHLLPFAVLLGYLAVLVFSAYAQSERFHQPILPLYMMFAAYGMTQLSKKKYRHWYDLWCIFIVVGCIAWSWFKLAGRGLA